ncbi:MAG: hypothetical protein IPO67_25510 [Deltaproteobacteria bacterium]|nr:hypothetical protein [Deltaproteobacteria bacterium]
MTAEEVVDFIGARLRQRPPAGVSVAYLDGFMRRHRAALVQLFREQLGDRLAGRALPSAVAGRPGRRGRAARTLDRRPAHPREHRRDGRRRAA